MGPPLPPEHPHAGEAANLAARLQQEHPNDLAAQVARAIRLTTGRQPNGDEVADDVAFIKRLIAEENLSREEAMQHYALLILNTNEFVYLD